MPHLSVYAAFAVGATTYKAKGTKTFSKVPVPFVLSFAGQLKPDEAVLL
jgi:hypothetical protein